MKKVLNRKYLDKFYDRDDLYLICNKDEAKFECNSFGETSTIILKPKQAIRLAKEILNYYNIK